jgi:pyruvate/2-oxoglutarate dehydrogenase complex dihydrolipoamide dehydrogenase (E3) component
MTTPQHYDVIIIGSGQAVRLFHHACCRWNAYRPVERECSGTRQRRIPPQNDGASGSVAHLARRAGDYGVHAGAIRIDLPKVRERKRNIVNSFRNGSQARIEKTPNLELIFGEARFGEATFGNSNGSRTVEVRAKDGTQRVLSAKLIFINAGTRAARPKLEGLDAIPALDNASTMELGAVPDHLLILGGGYIGLEFGQLFRRFGSRVTIVQSARQLVVREDPDVAEAVAEILRQDGIEVLLNARAVRVSKAGRRIRLDIDHNGNSATLAGSHLLMATGRVPNSDTLNLAALGIQTTDHGFIKVNDHLETTASGVYALGDIKGGPAFTHISYDDFRIIRSNLVEKKNVSISNRLVPYTLFIDPQLGRVGLTETDARTQKMNIRVARLPMNAVARAIEMDETRGFMKVIVDGDTNQIVGAAVLGIEGGEIMSAIEIAMMGNLPYTALRDGIFAHPTLMESLNNLFSAMDSSK